MLVAALTGREEVLNLYKTAVEEKVSLFQFRGRDDGLITVEIRRCVAATLSHLR